MRNLFLGILCLVCTPCFAQITHKIDTAYVNKQQKSITYSFSISNPNGTSTPLPDQVMEALLPVQRLKVGYLTIESEAANITVRASDASRKPVAVGALDKKTFLIYGYNTVWVDIFAVDFDKNIFNIDQVVINLDPDVPTPPDPDVPDPTIPDDAFDNLGQKVAGWSQGLPKKSEVRQMYQSIVARINSLVLLDINSISNAIKTERDQILGADAAKWKPLIDNVQKDLATRWPLQKFVYAEYLSAIAEGLK
jgi:hypothetical protein